MEYKGKISAKLCKPLIKIFLEFKEINNVLGELGLATVLIALKLAGKGLFHILFPKSLQKGCGTGLQPPLQTKVSSSAGRNAALSGYHLCWQLPFCPEQCLLSGSSMSFCGSWRQGDYWVQQRCLLNDFGVCWGRGWE